MAAIDAALRQRPSHPAVLVVGGSRCGKTSLAFAAARHSTSAPPPGDHHVSPNDDYDDDGFYTRLHEY